MEDKLVCNQLRNVTWPKDGFSSEEYAKLFKLGGCIGCDALMRCELLDHTPIEQWAFYGHAPGKEEFFEGKIDEFNERIKVEIENMYQHCKEFAFKWAVDIYDGPDEDLKAFLSEINDNIVDDIDYFVEDLIHERRVKEMENNSQQSSK